MFFCSGDLRYAPAGGYSENTFDVLESICNTVGVPLGHLFITPGNHDVDLNVKDRDAVIRKLLYTGNNSMKEYDSNIGTIDSKELTIIMSGTKEYEKIAKKVTDAQLSLLAEEIYHCNPHTLLKTTDLNVIELDSTIAYTKDRNSDLIIGTYYLQKILERCNPKNITVVLTHYSFDFLSREEQDIVVALFRDYNVRLWLSGHEHKHLFREQRGFFHELQCGNLLLENGAKTCILEGQLNTDTLEGNVKAHAWFSPDGWAVYPFVSPGTDDPETYYFDLNKKTSIAKDAYETSRRKLRDKISPLLEENQSIFFEYGPTDKNRKNIRTEVPLMWEKLLRDKIIPNSILVIKLLEENRNVLTSSEICTLNKYRLHIVGLQENHSRINGFALNAPQFPREIMTILL